MKRACIGLIVIAVLLLRFELARGADENRSVATLTVKVTDLRNRKGNLIFGVFKTGDGFPTQKDKSVDWQVKPASEGADAVVFTAKLPVGAYGASVLHD